LNIIATAQIPTHATDLTTEVEGLQALPAGTTYDLAKFALLRFVLNKFAASNTALSKLALERLALAQHADSNMYVFRDCNIIHNINIKCIAYFFYTTAC
jgi:hypothetical protein